MKSKSSMIQKQFIPLQFVASMTALMALIAAPSCSKKEQQKPDGEEAPMAADADTNPMGDSDSGQASGLQTVTFPYDSFVLDSSAKDKLRANAQLMKDKSSIAIQVEGHCDERGGIQYNIALGEKRANAVRKYLVDLGIGGNRVTTISFGKERPVDPGSNEGAWSKNRRANFVVTSR